MTGFTKAFNPQSFTDRQVGEGYCYDVPETKLGGVVTHPSGKRFIVGPTLVSRTLGKVNLLRQCPQGGA